MYNVESFVHMKYLIHVEMACFKISRVKPWNTKLLFEDQILIHFINIEYLRL